MQSIEATQKVSTVNNVEIHSPVWMNLSLDDLAGEIWRHVVGYEGIYSVSNLGRVKSWARQVLVRTCKPHFRSEATHIMGQYLSHGYPSVGLCRCEGHPKKKSVRVHRLVGLAFLENPEIKPYINHKNLVRWDNHLDNLEWSTEKENTRHAVENGAFDIDRPRQWAKEKNELPQVKSFPIIYTEEELATEIWKDIIGYRDIYFISNLGRVRSADQFLSCGSNQHTDELSQRFVPGKILTPIIHPNYGYATVNLYKNGKSIQTRIHRLVAQAFIPNPRNLRVVHHKDRVRNNNRLTNLEWSTHRGNTMAGYEAGVIRPPKGEENPLSKLTNAIVREIRKLWDAGIIKTKKELARKYGVSDRTIREVVNRVAWKHVLDEEENKTAA